MAATPKAVKQSLSKSDEKAAPKKKYNPADNLPGPGPGRPKGVPNKVTATARGQFTQLVEMKLGDASKWLDRIAKKDPARAFELLLRAAEFVLPRLTKAEYTGANGAPLPPGTAPAVVNVAQLMVSKDDGLGLYREMMRAAAVPDKLEASRLPASAGLADGEAAVVEGTAREV